VAQLSSYGVTIPLYVTSQLWTSPIVSGVQRDTILVHPLQVKLVPYSIILGYIMPVIILLLPRPSVLILEQKQILLAVWNVFPVVVTLIHFVLSTIGEAIFSRPNIPLTPTMVRSRVHDKFTLLILHWHQLHISSPGACHSPHCSFPLESYFLLFHANI
jgi:hypothetical protein